MKKNIIYLLLLFFVLLYFPSAEALSLIGKSTGPITYIPGTFQVHHYAYSDTNTPVKIYVDAGPFSHIRVSEVVDNQFDLIFDFPAEEYIPSGEYRLALSISENSESTAAISTQVAVSKIFLVKVLSYEKDVNIHLNAPSINQGNNLTLSLTVESVGYPDIDAVQGKITIHNSQQELLGTIFTETKSLPGLESLSFTPTFDSSKLPSSAYEVRAIVSYDGKFKTANTTFQIGNMDLQLLNYSSSLLPGFNDFSITVKNNWGNSLRNVYAKIFVGQQELLQTPSMNLEPWQEGKMKAIVQIPFGPGVYQGILKLFFEGEQKEVPITLQVVAPTPTLFVSEKKNFFESFYFIPTLVVLFILLVILSLLIIQKRFGGYKQDAV
ncbi:hypothetical protein HYV87_00180 [Candidatus Woesearchaeota archaeon]|nr:hypothetical protein [Candidatus Woesearchaeota archaeon]MBI2581530.1 hypothetical protein [Candidatus Woesearchaeota archaeon]